MDKGLSGAAARTGSLRKRRRILVIKKATRYLHRNTKQAHNRRDQKIITYSPEDHRISSDEVFNIW